MTFWELVKGRAFYWQMFTLSKGKQVVADGKTKRKPILLPSGTAYTRRLSVPADLFMYMVGKDTDTWRTAFAGTTLTIRMLKEKE